MFRKSSCRYRVSTLSLLWWTYPILSPWLPKHPWEATAHRAFALTSPQSSSEKGKGHHLLIFSCNKSIAQHIVPRVHHLHPTENTSSVQDPDVFDPMDQSSPYPTFPYKERFKKTAEIPEAALFKSCLCHLGLKRTKYLCLQIDIVWEFEWEVILWLLVM